ECRAENCRFEQNPHRCPSTGGRKRNHCHNQSFTVGHRHHFRADHCTRMAGDTDLQLLRVIKDFQASIEELCKDQERNELPITDANPILHSLCTRLEYLLQYDQKEKKTIFGSRKDYWDYINLCLNSHKCGTNAVEFINLTSQLTSLGKGRAFIRYCLVQQKLADSLQLCFLNQQLVRDLLRDLMGQREICDLIFPNLETNTEDSPLKPIQNQ
ncbi:hypothetical protein chiPu_0021578, partial [Chiloscyllium punctatum]|nr:hypothetical protein [Chiloscyllium punctatum]